MKRGFSNPVAHCLGIAALLVLFQIAVVYLSKSDPAHYADFCNWDCGWYQSIVEKGYFSVDPSQFGRGDAWGGNVAFFPAFPFLGWVVKSITGLHARISLVVAAQISAVAMWAMFLLWLKKLRVTPLNSALLVFGALAHPSSPFLVLGYSESLFLAAVLGYMYWSESHAASAAGSGFVMTATRLSGAPLVAFPVLARGAGDPKRRLLLAAAGLSGMVAFFAYCQIRFGHWNLYMKSLAAGWNIHSDYFALFRPTTYRWTSNPTNLAVPAGLATFGILLILELKWAAEQTRSRWRERLGFYAGAGGMFYLAVCASVATGLISMLRYTLPVYFLILLAVAHLTTTVRVRPRTADVLRGAFLLISVWWFFKFHTRTADEFTHMRWAG